MPSLLASADLDRLLADLPGVEPGRTGTLTLALTAPSFATAVRLISAAAEAAERMGHHPDVDLRWRTVTFTFSTHSAGGVTDLDLTLARAVLDAAANVGASVRPPAQRVEIALDVADADRVRPFWAAGLGYVESPGAGAGGVELHDPAGRGPVLWFQSMDPPRTERGRFHLEVYLADDEARHRLEACLASGGRLVTDAHAPLWWVVADAEGNELCLRTRAPHLASRSA
jgi:4a-hydroxytetrahydrobiopterin dehydratase